MNTYFLIFILTFASMSYQFLIGSILSEQMNGDLFIYPISIGFFILSMGIGCKRVLNNSLENVEYKIIFYSLISIFLTKSGSLS